MQKYLIVNKEYTKNRIAATEKKLINLNIMI